MIAPHLWIARRNGASFSKKVVDEAMIATYRSGAINPIYDKWFLKPIPPKGLNLNVPMSDAFKKVIASPTDSGDPAVY
jgi:glutamate/aspartate transport system substrate-binding protein